MLIATDLDGTLLRKDQTIDQNTLNKFKELVEKGHHIVVATGRVLGTTLHIANQLGFECDFICSNGAIVYNKKEGLIVSKPLSNEQVSEFLDIVENSSQFDDFDKLYYHAYSAQEMFASLLENTAAYYSGLADKGFFKDNFKVYIGNLRENINKVGQDVYKFGIIDDGSPNAEYIKSKILNIKGIMSVVSMSGTKDIMRSGVSKWTAIQDICKIRGIDEKDTIAFGNEENDIEMITSAGIGVAMANSTADVLKVAPNVTDSNEDEGIYKFLCGLDIF